MAKVKRTKVGARSGLNALKKRQGAKPSDPDVGRRRRSKALKKAQGAKPSSKARSKKR